MCESSWRFLFLFVYSVLFFFSFSSPPGAGDKRTQQNKVYDHHCHCQLRCCTLYYCNHYAGKTAPNTYYNVCIHTHTYAHTHASAQHTHVRTHTLHYKHTCARARAHTHTHTRARARTERERAEGKSLRVREFKCRRITSFWASFVRVLIYLSVIYLFACFQICQSGGSSDKKEEEKR